MQCHQRDHPSQAPGRARDLLGGAILWQLPQVTGFAALVQGAKPAFPSGSTPTLRAMQMCYLHDPRAKPEDGLRVIDIREDHGADAACVSLCRAHPHALFDRVAPHPTGDFEYLLLAPAKPGPTLRAWFLPFHQEPGSPYRTEIFENHALRVHRITSLRGAMRTESDLVFADDLHYVHLYQGHVALKLGLSAKVERIRPPQGYVHPAALIFGKSPERGVDACWVRSPGAGERATLRKGDRRCDRSGLLAQ